MKSEKHVTLAAQIVKTINPSVGVYEFNMDDLKEAIVSALSQVEREALASKVVFPDDEELLKRNEKYIKANKSSKNTFDDLDFAYYHGQLDLIDELKTAPNEPEVKAQEWAEKKASDIVNKFLHKPITDTYLCILKDEIIAVLLDAVDISKKYEKHDQSKTLNEKSDIPRSEVKAQGFEVIEKEIDKHAGCWAIANKRDSAFEDFKMGAHWFRANAEKYLADKAALSGANAACAEFEEWWADYTKNWDEDLKLTEINTAKAAFLAGQKSKAATLKLPERRIDNPEDMQWTAMETQGWNDCLDAVKALNEGDV